ncbi:MAG: DUF1800 domain-containing protein [Rubripirellula sp.]
MMKRIEQVDPDWAWEPFLATAETPWDMGAAAHLMRRAGFGATGEELRQLVARDPEDVVAELVAAQQPESFQREMASLVRASLASGGPQRLAAQWIYRMLNTPAPLLEKMTLFWHGHFATSAAKVEDSKLMQQQNELLREHALGDFSQLALEISRDPAMLLYLDSATNRKAHPNENYAREIMELFCLGEGNYTEQDIRELARCFTGWEIKREKFRINRYQEDTGEKTVLGRTGKLNGEDGVAIVVSQYQTARFITRKLVRFLVLDEPRAPDGLIEPLADKLREDDMRIAPTVQRILGSNLFFSMLVRGRKVRSPVEVAIGFLRSLNGSTDAFRLATTLQQLGQGLYFPPSVKGWDGGRTWINSSTLLGRSNLIRNLLGDDKTRFGKQGLEQHFTSQGAQSMGEVVAYLETVLFAVPLPDTARQKIAQLADSPAAKENRLRDAVHLLCTIPEFQLS